MAMLEVKDLRVRYGVIPALKGISFHVDEGEIIALIGANGAGKTTTLHTITGLVEKAGGSVAFLGKDITKTPAHQIVEMGIAHVPEGRRVFPEMTVYQNLMLGAYTRKDAKEKAENLERVYTHFPRLRERAKQVAGTLRLDLASYRELQAFAQFGSDLDADTKSRLALGERIVEVLKQKRSAPVDVGCQVAIVYAVINGYLNEVEPKDVAAYEQKLYEYLQSRYASLLERIEQGKWDNEEIEEMKQALAGFRG